MSLDDISDLLHLKRWSRDELRRRLGISLNTVDRWFATKPEQQRRPGPKECDLMRQWLAEARQEAISRWSRPAQPA